MKQYLLDNKIKTQFYNMLLNVTNLFNKYNIDHWASGGTLLGIIRHQGLIPWDDDLDIAILNTIENKNKIKNIKSELTKYNLGIVKMFYGYKIFDINGTYIKRQLWREHKVKFKKI